MAILPGIRVIVRRFLCIERRFLRHLSKKIYVHVLAQCAVQCSAVYICACCHVLKSCFHVCTVTVYYSGTYMGQKLLTGKRKDPQLGLKMGMIIVDNSHANHSSSSQQKISFLNFKNFVCII